MATEQLPIRLTEIKHDKPDADTEVLAISYWGEIIIGKCYLGMNNEYYCENEVRVMHRVTHWMDLGELAELRFNK